MCPRWGRLDFNDRHNWRQPLVVWDWSNRGQDVAILKLDRKTIDEYQLLPAPLSLSLPRGLRVAAIGFHRPSELVQPDVITGSLCNKRNMICTLFQNQRVIEVIFEDLPFEQGMSEGRWRLPISVLSSQCRPPAIFRYVIQKAA